MHKCLNFLSIWMFVFRLDIICLVFLNQNIKILMCQEKKSEATEPHNYIFRRHKLERQEDYLGNVTVTSPYGGKHTICTFSTWVCVTGCPFYMAVSRCQETLWFGWAVSFEPAGGGHSDFSSPGFLNAAQSYQWVSPKGVILFPSGICCNSRGCRSLAEGQSGYC